MQVERRIPTPPPPPDPPAEYHLVLTPREVRIVTHALEGLKATGFSSSVRAMASRLFDQLDNSLWLAEDGWDADR